MENNIDINDVRTREVVASNSNTTNSQVTAFNNYSDMNAMIEYAKPLVNSSLGRWKSPADIVLAMLRARDLGIPETTMYNKGFVMNGVVGVEAIVKRGLVEKHGILLEEIEDDKPLFQYNIKGVFINQDDFERNQNLYIVFNSVEEAKEAKEKGLTESKLIAIKNTKPYDYRTTIKATRWKQTPDGVTKVTKIVSFCLSTAIAAGLVDRNPHTWGPWRRDMLLHKCETRVCDLIASDITQGLMTLDELLDINKVKYHYEDAEIIID
jgi:hypothetical protein